MIPIKTEKELEIMREGGKKLVLVFEGVMAKVSSGVKLSFLNQFAELLIKKQRGFPSFKMVSGYKWATCVNINQGVVHGIPDEYRIKEDDIVSLDMGMYYQGFHTDMARTIEIQNSKFKIQNFNFLEAGKRALGVAIMAAKPGNRVGHISAAIEREIRKAGFSPIEALTGHGVGQKLHEDPQIPCFLKGKLNKTPKLKAGMTLAIEVIYAQGKPDLVLEKDGWTLHTADGKLAGLFEDTIAVSGKGPIILTRLN